MRRILQTFFAFAVSAMSAVSDTAPKYRVKEAGRTLEIETPDGKKVFFGNVGFDTNRDYRFVLPLDALTEKAEEQAKAKAKAQEPTKAGAEESVERELSSVIDPERASEPAAEKPTAKELKSEEYDDTDRLIVEANHFYNRGKFYEATLCVEEMIRKKPEFARAWIMKGSLLHVQGHRDLARKAWEKALTLEPQNNQIKDYLERYK